MSLGTSTPGITWDWLFHISPLIPRYHGASELLLIGWLSHRWPIRNCALVALSPRMGREVQKCQPRPSHGHYNLRSSASLRALSRGLGRLWGVRQNVRGHSKGIPSPFTHPIIFPNSWRMQEGRGRMLCLHSSFFWGGRSQVA